MGAQPVFIGIDVGKGQLDVARSDQDDVVQLTNDREGIQQLVRRLKEIEPELVVLEATGGFEVLAAAALLAGGFAVVSALRSGSAEENPFPPEEEIEAPPESAAPPIDSPAPTIGGTTAPPEPERSAPPVLPPSDPRPQVSPPTPQRSVLVTVPGITPQRGEDQAADDAREQGIAHGLTPLAVPEE